MTTGLLSPKELFERAPLFPTDTVAQWGKTLVVAPHADDETLGCGGAIAALCRRKLPVHILMVSDGSMSHPRSEKFPAPIRIVIREKEARRALKLLGADPELSLFLRLPDTQVPFPGHVEFASAVEAVRAYLERIQPDTILLPWRRDPHCDHRASWEILRAALTESRMKTLWQEYFIWTWASVQAADLPRPEEGKLWRLSVEESLERKKKAIEAHVSQTTRMIDDDPEGFILKPEVITHFTQPFEVYLHA
ncbi:LmbE family N-acetylglucosaminyl deacetylase [Catalinimonas alkaloidigena]|uniref:PIG-L deacetylase family protein n=1 Tax=Catalinimonas alkaloidigena TaxID=1075417 RepID=UPI00240630A7|nr:PIG-L deacetylase family protein [Catalinimonas alkaloidigena]MDF9797080.1 LmbE family N-acetylglucosaminyl deacetylase [Catalinimonas alkaloidigena]